MTDSGLDKFVLDKLDKVDEKLDQVKVEGGKLEATFIAHERRDEERHHEIKRSIDDLGDKVDNQNKHLQRNNELLAEHMRRTELLEKATSDIWERTEPVVEEYERRNIVDKHISEKWSKRIKAIGWAGVVFGTMTAAAKFFDMF